MVLVFPEMGVEGAAIGTIVSRLIMVIFILVYMYKDSRFQHFITSLSIKRYEGEYLKKVTKLGFPSALQMFFEVGFFTAAIWMSGLLGKNPQAANQIALNLSSMTYMVAMGLGVAAMIRVGNQLGRNNFVELRRIAISIFLLIFLLDLVFCIGFLYLIIGYLIFTWIREIPPISKTA